MNDTQIVQFQFITFDVLILIKARTFLNNFKFRLQTMKQVH